MREWIYGRNPVHETLRAARRNFFQLNIAQGVIEKNILQEILTLCHSKKIPIRQVQRAWFDTLKTQDHQGVALETSAYPYQTIDDSLILAYQRQEPPFLLILDALQDPQNLGSLLRTAEAVGVHGVCLPLRQTATVTPAVVSSSSGASEHLLVVQANLAQTMSLLKQKGIWIVGLEKSLEAQSLSQVRLDGPMAVVIGSEGSGMRQLVRKSCDILLQIPMRGQVESLNASVAGSVVLYKIWEVRGFK